MICINFQLHNLYLLKVLKYCMVEFLKLSFKLAFVYILSQSSDLFTRSSDMYAKQKHLGFTKKCEANKKQPYLCAIKSCDIS